MPFCSARSTLLVLGILVTLVITNTSFAAKQPIIFTPEVSADGTTRVIVGLQMAFSPEAMLANARLVTQQRIAIEQAQDALLAYLALYNVAVVQQYKYIPFIALKVDVVGLAYLKTAPKLASIEEDTLARTSLAESTVQIGAPAAWAQGFSGYGQTIAILDTGVDKTHPFLANKVVSEACYSNGNGRGVGTSLCPGGVTSSILTGSGVNCQISSCEHGTHVAGIAVGNGPNFSGVAKDANIIAIQVFTRFDTGCGTGSTVCIASYTSDQLAALERVYSLRDIFKIAAVNMSMGGSFSATNCDTESRKAAIDNLRAVNIATVISAGNGAATNGLSVPACISSAISVGSVMDGGPGATPQDSVSSFSNSASFLKLLAPGEVINSSVPGGGYKVLRGTSMATPHVAGAWAVLKSGWPSATVDQVLAALTSTGVPITDPRNSITTPRIQVDAALDQLIGFPMASVSDVSIAEGNTGTSNAVFTVSLSVPSTQQVTVNYATANDTASASSDYIATAGTLSFPAGATSQTIIVPIKGDNRDEPDETFFVTLAQPVNAALHRSRAIGTIVNDDLPPILMIGNARATQAVNGATTAILTLTLSSASSKTASVDYTLTDDMSSVRGKAIFAPDMLLQTISATFSNLNKSDTSIQVELANPVNTTIANGRSVSIITVRSTPVAQPIYLPLTMR